MPKTPLSKPRKKVTVVTVLKVVKLREQFPNFSKYKIKHLLENVHSISVSYSTIGRILKRKGLIDKKKSHKRRRASLRPKERYKVRIYSTKSSRTGKEFIEECRQSFDFEMKAVQTDNGSEFHKEFHEHLVRLSLQYVLLKWEQGV